VRAWDRYVARTEARIDRELQSRERFLAMEFEDRDAAAALHRELESGQIPVSGIETRDQDGSRIDVPGGAIHHWRGAVFIPGVTLESVIEAARHPEGDLQEDVLEARVLERETDYVRVYLKLVRTQIITVTFNSEHEARYRRHGPDRVSSRTVATHIAELEDAGGPGEREKAPGDDRGFLWRLNSYWRYAAVDGGVIVECESISLSRSIPLLVRPIVGPIVSRVARESMGRTLGSIRSRLTGPE
jgi:hypothetical protein